MKSDRFKTHAHAVWPNIEQFLNDLANTNLSDFGINEFVLSRPAANIIETPEAYTVQLAAPGMTKEQFSVNLKDGVLTITGKAQPSDHTYKRREFDYSDFKRSFKVGKLIDESAITAQYEQGMLNIVLPRKKEDDTDRKIHVV